MLHIYKIKEAIYSYVEESNMSDDKIRTNNINCNTDFNKIILNQFSVDVLNSDSIKYYIIDISVANNTQSFFKLDQMDLLSSIGAIAKGKGDKEFHPTLGGLLFFGNYKEIKQLLPNFRYFYGEKDELDKSYFNIIQTDNYNSWSGNLYDFFNGVLKSFIKDCKIPSAVEGLRRREESPITPILKEVLVNALLNVDYTKNEGLHIIRNISDKTIKMFVTGSQNKEIEYIRSFKNIKPSNKGMYKMFYLMGEGKKIKLGFNFFHRALRNLNCDLSFSEASDSDSNSYVLVRYNKYKYIKDQQTKSNEFRFLSDKDNLTSYEKIVLAFIRDDINISIDNLANNCNKSTLFVGQIIASLIKKGEIEDSFDENAHWTIL
jgi:hypothetical protein